MDRIDELLDKIESLPLEPKILVPLLGALADLESDMTRIVDMISFDPALTAKLLQICNSAFFGLAKPVNAVSEAVNRLGFEIVYCIAAIASGEQFYKPSIHNHQDGSKLWKHAVTTAFASQFIAKGIQGDGSLLFTVGLLHDIGKLVMGEALKDEYRALIENPHGPVGNCLMDFEQSHYGADHCEVGARILERWHFSPQFVEIVRYHHHPENAPGSVRMAACVTLADILAHNLDKDGTKPEGFPEETLAILQLIGMQVSDLSFYHNEVTQSLQFVEAVCHATA